MLHLIRRFFGFLSARRLRPSEQEAIAGVLGPAERRLFHAQRPEDQRHALTVMRHVAMVDDDPVMLRAALLHDVGKAATRLGALGRAVATTLDALRLPLWPSAATYRRHGAIGADLLRNAGAEPLVVDFAGRHPDPDPGPHRAGRWRLLLDADQR